MARIKWKEKGKQFFFTKNIKSIIADFSTNIQIISFPTVNRSKTIVCDSFLKESSWLESSKYSCRMQKGHRHLCQQSITNNRYNEYEINDLTCSLNLDFPSYLFRDGLPEIQSMRKNDLFSSQSKIRINRVIVVIGQTSEIPPFPDRFTCR